MIDDGSNKNCRSFCLLITHLKKRKTTIANIQTSVNICIPEEEEEEEKITIVDVLNSIYNFEEEEGKCLICPPHTNASK